MTRRLAHLVRRRPRHVIALWIAATVAAIVFGSSVTDGLIVDPGRVNGSESAAVEERLADIGLADPTLLAVVDGIDVDSEQAAAALGSAAAQISEIEGVAFVAHPHSVPMPELTATDGQAALVAVLAEPDLELAQRDHLVEASEAVLRSIDAEQVLVGGAALLDSESVEQNEADLQRAELISAPIVLILLFVVFGGVLAAGLPLAVAAVAVPGTLLVLTAASWFTDLSVFALNAATMLGLGLAVDYALLVISRFRSERAGGLPVAEAVDTTIETAGRTVLFSGLTVAVSLLGFLVFDQMVFTSIGIGGMGVVILAMSAALTLLPALLHLLGHRISIPDARRPAKGGVLFASLARVVQRRAGAVVLAVGALLIALALPFAGARLQIPGPEGLASGLETRELFDVREDRFATGAGEPIVVLLESDDPAELAATADSLRTTLAERTDVTAVNQRLGTPATAAVIDVTAAGRSQGPSAEALVQALRSGELIDAAATSVSGSGTGAAVTIAVGGVAAELIDGRDALLDRLSFAVALIASATLVLLFLLTGSILIPLKAMVMNLLSLTATFGVLVWGFQDGGLAGLLGFDSVGYLSLWLPFLVFFLAFGLSMDYEVFLLSRVAEEYESLVAEGHPTPNNEAVVRGLTATGGIITSAAALIAVVFASFTTAGAVEIKALGVGLALAVVLDASIVRALLVPATMKLLGEWNWWAPAPLRRFHNRFGIAESGARTKTERPASAGPGAGPPLASRA